MRIDSSQGDNKRRETRVKRKVKTEICQKAMKQKVKHKITRRDIITFKQKTICQFDTDGLDSDLTLSSVRDVKM